MTIVDYTNFPDYIPYELRVKALAIEPKLDIYWQDYLKEILQGVSAKCRQNICEQILNRKNIFWNESTQAFEYKDKTQGGSYLPLLATPEILDYKCLSIKLLNHYKH
ncbi:MAG: hypothetical protein IK065_05125 [Neisseriaceae bacterium]|nr:hypothetical protein [Neisseriaceae bacterium]